MTSPEAQIRYSPVFSESDFLSLRFQGASVLLLACQESSWCDRWLYCPEPIPLLMRQSRQEETAIESYPKCSNMDSSVPQKLPAETLRAPLVLVHNTAVQF